MDGRDGARAILIAEYRRRTDSTEFLPLPISHPEELAPLSVDRQKLSLYRPRSQTVWLRSYRRIVWRTNGKTGLPALRVERWEGFLLLHLGQLTHTDRINRRRPPLPFRSVITANTNTHANGWVGPNVFWIFDFVWKFKWSRSLFFVLRAGYRLIFE